MTEPSIRKFANVGLRTLSVECEQSKGFLGIGRWQIRYVLIFQSGSSMTFDGPRGWGFRMRPGTRIMRQFHAQDPTADFLPPVSKDAQWA